MVLEHTSWQIRFAELLIRLLPIAVLTTGSIIVGLVVLNRRLARRFNKKGKDIDVYIVVSYLSHSLLILSVGHSERQTSQRIPCWIRLILVPNFNAEVRCARSIRWHTLLLSWKFLHEKLPYYSSSNLQLVKG